MNLKTVTAVVVMSGLAMASLPEPVQAQVKKYDLSNFITVDVNAGYQQRDIKQVVLRVEYPRDVELVGQAINYTLLQTGYSLAPIKDLKTETLELFARPLPSVHRQFTDVTLQNILETLVGPAYSVMYDEYARTVLIIPHRQPTTTSK